MPTYDYRCQKCGHEFEKYHSITAAPLKRCPACGERTLQRLIGTGGGIIFKGSGFYQTDYRSESYKKAAAADTKPAASPSDGKGSDSKDAAKPASSGDSKEPAKASSSGDSKEHATTAKGRRGDSKSRTAGGRK